MLTIRLHKKKGDFNKEYYVHGSELFGVPAERIGEVRMMKEEHDRLVGQKVMMVAVLPRIV
jgi:hypothetical protein